MQEKLRIIWLKCRPYQNMLPWAVCCLLFMCLTLFAYGHLRSFFAQEAEQAQKAGSTFIVDAQRGFVDLVPDPEATKPEEEAASEPDAPSTAEATPPPKAPDPGTPAFSVDADPTHPMAIVIAGLGLDSKVTKAALALPSLFSFSLSPYAKDPQYWLDEMHRANHETLLDLPMETRAYPFQDPGPYALLTHLEKHKNLSRLQTVLNRGSGYQGLLVPDQEKFTHGLSHIIPVLDTLRQHNKLLAYQERRQNTFLKNEAKKLGMQVIRHVHWVDGVLSRPIIEAELEKIEALLEEDPSTPRIVAGHAYPLVINQLQRWIEKLAKKGIRPATLSSIQPKQAPKAETADLGETPASIEPTEPSPEATPPATTPNP